MSVPLSINCDSVYPCAISPLVLNIKWYSVSLILYRLPYTPVSTCIFISAVASNPFSFVTVHFITCVPDDRLFVFSTTAFPLLVSVYTIFVICANPLLFTVKYLLNSFVSPFFILTLACFAVTIGGCVSI